MKINMVPYRGVPIISGINQPIGPGRGKGNYKIQEVLLQKGGD